MTLEWNHKHKFRFRFAEANGTQKCWPENNCNCIHHLFGCSSHPPIARNTHNETWHGGNNFCCQRSGEWRGVLSEMLHQTIFTSVFSNGEYKETFDVEKSRRKAIKSRAPNFVFSSLRPASPSFASMRLVFIFVSRIYIWCAEWIFHLDGIVRHWQFPLLLLCLFDQKRFAIECAYKSVY